MLQIPHRLCELCSTLLSNLHPGVLRVLALNKMLSILRHRRKLLLSLIYSFIDLDNHSDRTTRIFTFQIPTDITPVHINTHTPVHTIPTITSSALRAYNPASNVLAFSHSQRISLVNLSTQVRWDIGVGQEGEELVRALVSVSSLDSYMEPTSQWSGVIGVKFLTPRHLLCVKTRSVEVYTFSGSFKAPGTSDPQYQQRTHWQATAAEVDIQRHDFPRTTFRGVSFADSKMTSSSAEDGAPTISCDFLAYDVLRGLFHYRVQLPFPSIFSSQEPLLRDLHCPYVSPPLTLDTTLVSVHHMAQAIPPAERPDTPTPRSGFTPGSRGFVSSCSLGPQGTRGIWVERQRSSVKRAAYGFDVVKVVERDGLQSEEEPVERQIAGKCICELNSFDLRGMLLCAWTLVPRAEITFA